MNGVRQIVGRIAGQYLPGTGENMIVVRNTRLAYCVSDFGGSDMRVSLSGHTMLEVNFADDGTC
jgi:hypothetical protein